MTNETPLSIIIADGLDASVDGRGWDAKHQAAQDLANAAPALLAALIELDQAFVRGLEAGKAVQS